MNQKMTEIYFSTLATKFFFKPEKKTRSNQESATLCQNVNTQILYIKFCSSYYSFSLVCICSVEFKLLSIIVCTKLCVQLRARFCTLAQLLSKIM